MDASEQDSYVLGGICAYEGCEDRCRRERHVHEGCGGRRRGEQQMRASNGRMIGMAGDCSGCWSGGGDCRGAYRARRSAARGL